MHRTSHYQPPLPAHVAPGDDDEQRRRNRFMNMSGSSISELIGGGQDNTASSGRRRSAPRFATRAELVASRQPSSILTPGLSAEERGAEEDEPWRRYRRLNTAGSSMRDMLGGDDTTPCESAAPAGTRASREARRRLSRSQVPSGLPPGAAAGRLTGAVAYGSTGQAVGGRGSGWSAWAVGAGATGCADNDVSTHVSQQGYSETSARPSTRPW